MIQVSASAALDAIEAAFRDEKYPGDENIVYNNSPLHLSCARVRDKLSGLRWIDVSPDLVSDTAEDLVFLTPQAIRYFLPGYMRVVLLNPTKFFTLNSELIGLLTLIEKRLEWFRERFAEMAEPEVQAVVMFLLESASRKPVDLKDDAETAIASFWGLSPERRRATKLRSPPTSAS